MGRMRPIEFVPVIGVPIGINRVIESDQPFQSKVYDVAQISAMQTVFTIVGMSKNYIAAAKARNLTKAGISVARTSPVTTSALLTIVAQKQLAEKKGYVPTGGQGSGFGSSFSFLESLGITF